MRHVGYVALALIAVACGPDPNAHLPGTAKPSGGVVGSTGGATVAPPASGGNTGSNSGGTGGVTSPATGGTTSTSPFNKGGTSGGTGGVATGGNTGSGGITSGGGGSGGIATGGVTSAQGGVTGTGGTTSVPGTGGTSTPSTGSPTSYTFPTGTEPCTPTKDFSGGHSDQLGAGAICFRTADDITDWSCSGADDRTVKVNAVESKCGAAGLKKVGSFYYFEFSAGTNAWASISWWCSTCGGPGTHAVPSCGSYPAWQSGATVEACSTSTTAPSPDASAPVAPVDSGT